MSDTVRVMTRWMDFNTSKMVDSIEEYPLAPGERERIAREVVAERLAGMQGSASALHLTADSAAGILAALFPEKKCYE